MKRDDLIFDIIEKEHFVNIWQSLVLRLLMNL